MERWQVRHALICVIGKSTYNEQVAFFSQRMDRCPSGLRSTPRKRVRLTPPRVRISPYPPAKRVPGFSRNPLSGL